MPSNVEIKARVRDFNALLGRLRSLSDSAEQVIPQKDTFFATQRGRLKLRELQSGEAQLIYYERSDEPGPKRSDYSIFVTKEPSALKSLLGRALGIRGEVKKVRHLFMIGQTRVHLDLVEGLGAFVELEVVLKPAQTDAEGYATAESLIARLDIARDDLLESAYMDLLEQVRP